MSMTIKELKEELDKFPETYKVKFYVNDVVYSLQAFGYSPFNDTFFLFGNREIKRELTKEQMLEELNKLVKNVTEAEIDKYII